MTKKQTKIKKVSPKKTLRKLTLKKKVLKILIKSEANPIISPKPENKWESWQTFNPGVINLADKIHFLYRAIGEDGTSRFGYAASPDGFFIDERLDKPVYPVRDRGSLRALAISNGIYEHETKKRVFNIFSYFSGGSWGGAEDPRLVRVDNEDTLYMTYTACDNEELRVALTGIKVEDFLNKKWVWKTPILISPPGEVHKNWLLFPEKIRGQYAILHSIKPTIQIDYLPDLEFRDGNYIKSFHGGGERKSCWDKWVRGAGAPPLKTKDGWLLFYHAMDDDWSKYKVGAMLLDLNDPTKILHRAKEPVLEPSEDYENSGYKGGVVYVSGAVVKDGNILVYYGAADSCVSVAYANLDEFLEALQKEARPKLKLKTLKKK